MEDFKKVLEKTKLLLPCSTDDDSDCESIFARQSSNFNKYGTYVNEESFDIKCLKPLTNRKRNGERRLPTRKPDPNVYNRNALLARENRRKKKVYLETIERELDVIRKANRDLAKALRRQLKIAERLQKEKQYYEDIVNNRLKIVGLVNATSFHDIQRAGTKLIAANSKENDIFKDTMNITRSRSCSPNGPDNVSMIFDSASDGSVVASNEGAACDFSSFDFSFPEFSTDLYDSSDVTLPTTSTTWDDIWGDKEYNVDNFISCSLATLQDGIDMQSSSVDHCYARNKVDSSDQDSDPCDFIDVEGVCSCNGTICAKCRLYPTYHAPPIQLLNKQSS